MCNEIETFSTQFWLMHLISLYIVFGDMDIIINTTFQVLISDIRYNLSVFHVHYIVYTFTFNLFRYNSYIPCYRKFNPSKYLRSVNQYYLTWSQLLKILYISIKLFFVSSDRHSYYTNFYILINLDENEKYIQNSTKLNSII